jgi:2'-5' RNA ligase
MPAGQLPVERLILYRSHLGAGPARYQHLAEFPLQARVTAGGNR